MELFLFDGIREYFSFFRNLSRKNFKLFCSVSSRRHCVVSIAIREGTRGGTGGRSGGCALRGPPTLRYNGQLMAGGPADPR